MECPACSHPHSTPTRVTGALECCRCGALHGQCTKGDSHALVLPRLSAENVPPERWRYDDLMVVGSDGLSRPRIRGRGKLGWFDPETRLVVQIG